MVIKSTSTDLSLKKTNWDYETAPLHTVTVRLSEDGTNWESATITILVADVEEHAPVFREEVIRSVRENTIGPVYWLFVDDVDTDLDDLTFSIIDGNDDGLFAIKPPSGGRAAQLVRVGKLDYETASLHILTIQVSDGEKTDISKVVVFVDDTNDHAPIFTQASYTANIADDSSSGALVIVARSIDADSFLHRSYSFAENGNPDDLFAIDANTGAITLAGTLDRTTATHTYADG